MFEVVSKIKIKIQYLFELIYKYLYIKFYFDKKRDFEFRKIKIYKT